MRWLMNWLGLASPLRKKRKELSNVRVQALRAQRNGDIRGYSKLAKKIEELEDEIVGLIQ